MSLAVITDGVIEQYPVSQIAASLPIIGLLHTSIQPSKA
jgi:hypothetical protein